MSQYNFITCVNGIGWQSVEPLDYPDDTMAIAEAIKCLAGMARDELPFGAQELSVTVLDLENHYIYGAALHLSVMPKPEVKR